MKRDVAQLLMRGHHFLDTIAEADEVQRSLIFWLFQAQGISRRDAEEGTLVLRFANNAERDTAFAFLSKFIGNHL